MLEEERYRSACHPHAGPAEQARIVRLLVERVDLSSDGIRVRLRVEGLQTLVEELRSREVRAA
jgi:hypothetical protein